MTISPGLATPMTKAGFGAARSTLGVSDAALWAVIDVETPGCGYGQDMRPVILYERHVFHRLTVGRYFSSRPDISNPVPGNYGPSGQQQYDRLEEAFALDPHAALQSASWGLGQIMGFNFKFAGYTSAEEMVSAFCDSEDEQLAAMAEFISEKRAAGYLRDNKWQQFAAVYNGPDYARNAYDIRLDRAYRRRCAAGQMDFDVRARQVDMFFKGRYYGRMDGICGPMTLAAAAAET